MNILIDIGHPAHVHLFRNIYFELLSRKHKIWVTVKDIPVVHKLLNSYTIPFIIIGKKNDKLIGKLISQFSYNFKILKLVRDNKINIGIGSSITIAHISKISKMKSIIFDDDDDKVQPLFVKYAHPFADTILSPKCLIGKRKNKKTVFYNGFHELAYLHPNRFKPNPEILYEIGLNEDDVFFILRFNVFKAHHDIGENGMSFEQKLKLIKLLKCYGKIFITTEREIEPELKKYQLSISPEKTHSLMYYATMFLGDSQTMTSESAIIGTPAIRMNSFVGEIAYLEELELKYKLTYGFKPNQFTEMLLKVESLLKKENLKKIWKKRNKKMIIDKSDITSYFIWFIENYPKSKNVYRN
tara:strand:+ start:504 stop:1568 length:1065 start_codon:yes stop_codon:yes gene_type:complete